MKARNVCLLCVIIILTFYLSCFNYIEPSQIGIARNVITGEVVLQDKGGWKVTEPWVQVACIDTRPVRVGVLSAGKGWDAKLVVFEPKGYKEFIKTEGFHYYWWANRFSINFGHNDEFRGMKDILRGYAYSTKHYSFIKVIEEYKAN